MTDPAVRNPEPDHETAPPAPAEREPAASPRVHLTAAALEAVREMLAEEGLLEAGGLRLSFRPGAGCSAPMQFGMVLDEGPDPGDVVLEGRGIRIFMDSRSVWGLDGLQVDYVDAPGMGSGFAFRHPRGAGGCAR